MRVMRPSSISSAWLRLPIRFKGIAVAALPVVGFLLMLGWVSRIDSQRSLSQQLTDHTEQVKLQTRYVLGLMLDAESGVRGFALSGDEDFLKPYQRTKANLPIALQTLKKQLKDDPTQTQRGDNLARLATDKMQVMSDVVERTRELTKHAAAVRDPDLFKSLKQGKALMDASRMQIAAISGEQDRLHELRSTALRNHRRWLGWAVLFGWFLSLAGPIVGASLFSSGITRRLNALATNATRLAQGRELLPLISGGDEVSMLDRQLHVTASQIAERQTQLTRSEERFRSLVAATSQIVWTTDANGEVVVDSPGWRQYTGQTEAEFLGAGWLSAVHPEDRERTGHAWQEATRTRSPYEIEYRLRKHDGTYGYFGVRGVPISEDGEVREWVGSCSDITQRKEVERMKDELVATVSHELRTPLASLRGFAELMLQREYSKEKTREFLGIIHNESKRLTNLINNFLDLQKIEAGLQTCALENTDLASLIHESVALYASTHDKHSIHIDIPRSLPVVPIDPDKIRQVLANLLSNALKYSPKGGRVDVRVTEQRGEVVVSVRDSGIGIPKDVLSHLFTKFFRAENSIEYGIGGTGLGLALVKQIVELHGGRIGVESQPGLGSTFWFALPARQTGDIVAFARPSDTVDVLIVEDDGAFANLLGEHLGTLGLSVAKTPFAEEALQMIRTSKPRLMLVDLKLAGRMCGWELLLAVKTDSFLQSIPVAIMTMSEPNTRGLALGGSEYVSKSAPPDALLNAVQRRLPVSAKQILLVDDDAVYRASIVELLTAQGFVVRESSGGREAMEQIRIHHPDLVLLDLLMPDMDGFEVLRLLRSDASTLNTQVLVITAKTLSGDDKHYIKQRLATLVGKRETDLSYFTQVVGQMLGKRLEAVTATA